MKATEFKDKSITDLVDTLKKLKSELFKLRFQLHTKQLKNTSTINKTRKTIARVRTVIRQKEMTNKN